MVERPRQAVILAGGRGTRLKPLSDERPKAMIEFHGKPFLGYLVDLLREQGFERLLLLLGYLPHVIIDHFGDGRVDGVRIDYDVTDADDLTAFRLQHAQHRIEDTFLLLYCDNYWPMRFDRMWAAYTRSGAEVQVTVYENRDHHTKNSVRVADNDVIDLFDRSRTANGLNGVEIGYAITRKDVVLPLLPQRQQLFEEAVYPVLSARGTLRAYRTSHRYYSVGDHERLPLTDAFFARKPAVLLDRDGVLNERPAKAEYVRNPADFRWLGDARDALRTFAEADWRVIVVSNQAGIGRGTMTEGDLDAVHRRMREEAIAAGGRIDAIYHCPHDWNAGCDCRKPRPGLLLQAQRDFHLDLSRTCFIGDDERDAEAAHAAGAASVLLSPGTSLAHIARRLVDGTLETSTV